MEDRVRKAGEAIVAVKSRGGKVVVVTGSGPNLHEGVTTLVAELIRVGVVDGVLTSAAVVAHEMAGTLDRVKRIRVADVPDLGIPLGHLPRGGVFEITVLSEVQRRALDDGDPFWQVYDRIAALPGTTVIKAAGNMAWPMGLRTERLARKVLAEARAAGVAFEEAAGRRADPRTMIGAASRAGVPLLVTIPQLVGGGAVGLAIGDSIPVSERARRVAALLGSADVIIESAIALSQEVHDGPFEVHTGHGIWAAWEGAATYSLEDKTLIRIDLDPNIERAWAAERESAAVQSAVDRGLPKTKLTGIPFRMEMSGFARLPGSLPITGDIGAVWPVLARHVAAALGVTLEFVSAPQESPEGQAMREWIADNIAAAL